jgi:hypothetical protein
MAGARVAGILATLVAGGPPSIWPSDLVHACRDATAVTGVGLALVGRAGINGIVAATRGAARDLEDLQFTLGEGPCVEASRTGRPVLCPNLAADGMQRWPAFTSGAEDLGVAAAFTFPLRVGDSPIGVLDLYRRRAGRLEEPHLEHAVAFADAAVAVLLHLQERVIAAPNTGAPGLADLADRRSVVHQAAGMISVQLDSDVADALLRLRAHAWVHQIPIAQVATEVVARRLRFDDSSTGTAQVGGSDPDGRPGGEPQ